jgi:hypothetical protein
MRFCFRPFRLFLSSIGRFPYKIVKEKNQRENSVVFQSKKGNNFSLRNGFVNQVKYLIRLQQWCPTFFWIGQFFEAKQFGG